MSVEVTVLPSGRKFSCEGDESILSAALRAGIGLPYGCKNGACGSCKGKIVNGKVNHTSYQAKALTSQELTTGMSLFCCARPETDVTIEAREIQGSEEYPLKKMPTRVAKLEKLSQDVMLVDLQLPANERLAYRAGQYIEFILRDGSRRSYSMATPPHQEGNLSLHIRHMPGGVFTDQVFSTMKERDILRFEGPHGSFFIREDSDKPIILLASGTGFAPIKAIMEHLIYTKSPRPVSLYWGGRRPVDLYLDQLCQSWAGAHSGFNYVPVVSEALAEDQWSGRTGFVHQAVMQDFPDLSGHQVYACGAPVMVESAKRDFVANCQLPADEFYADAFTSAADLAK